MALGLWEKATSECKFCCRKTVIDYNGNTTKFIYLRFRKHNFQQPNRLKALEKHKIYYFGNPLDCFRLKAPIMVERSKILFIVWSILIAF